MKPALVGHPVAVALLACSLGVWGIIEVWQSLRRRDEATRADRGSVVIVRLFVAAGILLAAWALRATATAFSYNPVLVGVGLCLIWSGVGLRWWCFRTLGRYFTLTVMTSAV